MFCAWLCVNRYKKKPVLLLLRPPQILHRLTSDQTQASSVRETNLLSHGMGLDCFVVLFSASMQFFLSWLDSPQWVTASSLSTLHDHPQTHHSRQDFSGRVISLTQRPLPDNTQHSQETDIHAPGGIPTRNPKKRAAAYPLCRPRGHSDANIGLKHQIDFCHSLANSSCTDQPIV